MMWWLAGSYLSSLTPSTIVMSSPLAGALMITFWAPAAMWAPAFSALGEDAGGLEDDVDAEVLPRQVRRILLGEDLDLAAIDDDRPVAGLDLAVVPPVRRVVLEQQGVHLGVDQVVHRHDFDVGGALDHGLEGLAADAAEPVDADAGRHGSYSSRSGSDTGGRPEIDCNDSFERDRGARAWGVADPRALIVRRRVARRRMRRGCDLGGEPGTRSCRTALDRPLDMQEPPPSPAGVRCGYRLDWLSRRRS